MLRQLGQSYVRDFGKKSLVDLRNRGESTCKSSPSSQLELPLCNDDWIFSVHVSGMRED